MSDLEDIKVGDEVTVESRRALQIVPVTAVSPKQFATTSTKWWKHNGRQVGHSQDSWLGVSTCRRTTDRDREEIRYRKCRALVASWVAGKLGQATHEQVYALYDLIRSFRKPTKTEEDQS